MQERWQMNKLGFVNFWLYDCEEFPFSDGRLLLRGENGAGKSVTTQSFIPFMLDGDLRPYRLDAFGSKDRRMEYYLLGDEKDENTGYLYLEFTKPEQRMYRTLVVGLRARKSKPTEFWGFCLSDGRRVGTGQDEFALFETRGSQHISLSRQEVHNRFGFGENWAERSSDYKQMVNRMLFGCAEMEQYDRLLKLLIQLRKPKLSKDFSPHLVREILNASLQPLSEDDIAPMVNSMEKMDNIQLHLDELQQSLQAARLLRNEYTRYNQYLLGKKAEFYLSARHTAEKLSLDVQDQESSVLHTEQELQSVKESLRNASQQKDEFSRQLEVLHADDQLEASFRRLEQLRAEAQQLQAELAREEETEQKKQAAYSSKEMERDLAQRRCDDQSSSLQSEFSQLERLNQELQYPGHPAALSALDLSAQRAPLEQYARQLRAAADLLRRRKAELDQMDIYQQNADAAAEGLQHACSQRNAAEQMVVQERDTLCAAFARMEDPELPFRLSRAQVKDLFQQVSEYEGTPQEQAISSILIDAYRNLLQPLQAELSRLSQIQLEQQECLNNLDAQKSALERQPELPPPRSQSVQETRAFLRQREVPHAAFYELVDFDAALSLEQRALLEAQLMDAGVLDALVFPPEKSNAVAQILQQHPDHFLALEDTPAVSAPLPLHADPNAPAWADVAHLLAHISAEPGGIAFFAKDGQYRQGIVQGHSLPVQPASYIGASARRDHRLRQIEALALQIEAQRQLLTQTREQIRKADAAIDRLEESYAQHPTTADLAAVLQIASSQRAEVEQWERRFSECRQQVKDQQVLLDTIRAQLLPLTRGLCYEHTVDAYEQAIQSFDEYQSKIFALSAGKQNLELLQSRVEDLEQRLDELNDDLLECTDRIRLCQANRRKTQAAINALEEYHARPEVKELAQKVKSLRSRLEQAQNQCQRANEQIIRLENDLSHLRPSLEERKLQLQFAIEAEEHKRQIFEEELCQGPGQPGLGDTPLWQQAEAAKNGIRQNDRGLGLDRLRTSLEKSVRDASALNPYRVTLNSIFDSEDDELRARVRIDLYPSGQRMDLLDFIRRIESNIEADKQLLSQEDRRLFETILNQTITTKLSHRINNSQDWTNRMSRIMEGLNTSMGLRFSLRWKGKPADQQDELATLDLIELLRKDPAIMGDADRDKITNHFRAKIAKARELSQGDAAPATYSELMRQALDFRSWFTFHIYFEKGASADASASGSSKKELTDTAFNSFSGGEKAMAMYVPLFAALSAQYGAASEDAPQLMALDEAFAGVDETNIASMFNLVHQLGLNYVMNSQALWGCYACVPSLNIAELWRPQDADLVTVVHYHWDGHVRRMEEL